MNPPTTQALAEGALGMALPHIERGDLAAVRPLLADAITGGVSIGANACLFHGAPALEFVLGRAARADHHIQAAVDRVVAARLTSADQRRRSTRLPHPAEFDLIRGLTGLGALLLTRSTMTGPASAPLLNDVLAYLVSLAGPARASGRALPGWWSHDSPPHTQVAGGHGNNGVAHGIAGPLALLSIAARHGIQVDGQTDAIETFAAWLEQFGTRYWITLNQLTSREPQTAPPLRPSWCYSDLGIARALQLAAVAVGDPARRRAAEDTAMAALTDPDRLSRITDASLCHGWAGALTVTLAIAADSPTPQRFAAPTRQLRRHLAEGIDALPKPGFMEGWAGAQLALDGTNTTGWTHLLLID